MITFIRSFFSSKIGLAVTFAFVALIAFAFAGSDLTGTANLGGGGQASGGTIAEVGDREIGETEFSRQMQNQLEARRQTDVGLDMTRFIGAGGFDATLGQLIDVRALEAFAEKSGIAASKRLVDGEIASLQAFFGPTGSFDRNVFLRVISERRLSEQQIRADVAAGLIARQVEVPAYGAAVFPVALVRPYAALSLEARSGLSALVPVSAIPAGVAPTDQELSTYYKRNVARYTVPERRIVRYALFGRAQIGAAANPSESEVAAYYRDNAARYAASETRTLTQLILQDQNAARVFATKVASGTAFAAAAAQAGLEPVTLADQTRAGYAGVASPAVANAVFAAVEGAIVPPQRSPLGWHVVRVDAVTPIPGRSLAEARTEIAAGLARQKLLAALADQDAKIQDAIADGATFDEIVKANGLQTVTTPAITASGADPGNPQFRPDAAFARFLAPMFQAETDDDPLVEALVEGEQYVLSDLDRVVAAAPRPLREITAQVAADFSRDRAFDQARQIADAIAAKAARGVPLAQAMRESGIALPAPKPIGGVRRELTAGGAPLGADVVRLFEMAAKTAKRVEAPNRGGWYVVYLDTVTPGNADADPRLVAAMQGEFSRLAGREYAAQLASAAKADIGVKRNPKAEAALKARLSGTGGQ